MGRSSVKSEPSVELAHGVGAASSPWRISGHSRGMRIGRTLRVCSRLGGVGWYVEVC